MGEVNWEIDDKNRSKRERIMFFTDGTLAMQCTTDECARKGRFQTFLNILFSAICKQFNDLEDRDHRGHPYRDRQYVLMR